MFSLHSIWPASISRFQRPPHPLCIMRWATKTARSLWTVWTSCKHICQPRGLLRKERELGEKGSESESRGSESESTRTEHCWVYRGRRYESYMIRQSWLLYGNSMVPLYEWATIMQIWLDHMRASMRMYERLRVFELSLANSALTEDQFFFSPPQTSCNMFVFIHGRTSVHVYAHIKHRWMSRMSFECKIVHYYACSLWYMMQECAFFFIVVCVCARACTCIFMHPPATCLRIYIHTIIDKHTYPFTKSRSPNTHSYQSDACTFTNTTCHYTPIQTSHTYTRTHSQVHELEHALRPAGEIQRDFFSNIREYGAEKLLHNGQITGQILEQTGRVAVPSRASQQPRKRTLLRNSWQVRIC